VKQSLLSPTFHENDYPAEETDNLDVLLPGGGIPEKPTLNLIRELCRALSEERIAYCHWKSNNALDRSASGDNDLDLLVSRADAQGFGRILNRLDFKQAVAPIDRSVPGILDYYGYDKLADRMVHVHVHYQLIVGHDMNKNYHLPIETPYLDSVVQDDLFRVPAPEFELIVFVIRMVLKHLTWETILIRNGKLSFEERQELSYLLARSDMNQVNRILQKHLPYLGTDLFERCLQALKLNASLWTRISVGRELLKALKAQARRDRLQDIWLKLWRRVTWGIQRRVYKRVSKRRLANGGATIVIAGGDGAGKSTAIDGLYDWLSNDFEVSKLHMGKPMWSWTTKIVRAILGLGRMLGFYPFVSESSVLYASKPDTRLGLAYYSLLIRQLCRSRDRLLAYVRARRLAMNGGIVLCDRFPLSQINLMDGPIIRQLVDPKDTNWLVDYMIRLEEKNYQSFVWPELLIVLKLDPQVAVQRKTDEDGDYVRARSQLIWSFDWQQTPAYVIDASLRREDVLATLKSHIWSML
jgi:thymidylate kinase